MLPYYPPYSTQALVHSSVLPCSLAIFVRSSGAGGLQGASQFSCGVQAGCRGRWLLGSCPTASAPAWASFCKHLRHLALDRCCGIGYSYSSIYNMKMKNRPCGHVLFGFWAEGFQIPLLCPAGSETSSWQAPLCSSIHIYGCLIADYFFEQLIWIFTIPTQHENTKASLFFYCIQGLPRWLISALK